MAIKETTDEATKRTKYLAVPADLAEDFEPSPFGPCEARDHYVTIQTNQIGELQVHGCKWNSFCFNAFVFSAVYGWLDVLPGNPVRERVREAIDEAIAAGVFRRGTRIE